MGPKNKDKKGTKSVSDTPNETHQTHQTTQDSDEKAAAATDAVTLQTILNKINTLATDMKCMKDSISEIKEDIKELKSLPGKVEEIKIIADNALENSEQNSGDINILQTKLATANNTIQTLQASCDNMNNRLVQQDTYSRKDNLLFANVEEVIDENCEHRVRSILEINLKMNKDSVANIKIVRFHRMGERKTNATKPHPIICRFHFFGERQDAWKRRSQLKDSGINMQEDFPQEIIAKRNQLAPVMFAARRKEMKAFLVADRLIIDGRSYTVNTLKDLPETLDLLRLCTTKISDTITAFFGSLTPLSNFHPAKFTLRGFQYHSSEQFLHHNKSLLFKDDKLAARIMAASTAAECKNLGRKVANFNINIWNEKCKDIMKNGLIAKFRQNHHCFKVLEATNNSVLVEASLYDKLWGVGLGVKDPNLANMQLWKGDNLLGKILEEVRKDLIG